MAFAVASIEASMEGLPLAETMNNAGKRACGEIQQPLEALVGGGAAFPGTARSQVSSADEDPLSFDGMWWIQPNFLDFDVELAALQSGDLSA